MKKAIVFTVAMAVILFSLHLCAAYFKRRTQIVKPCKCDCSYMVLNADSVITAKGDTVAYPKSKAWQ